MSFTSPKCTASREAHKTFSSVLTFTGASVAETEPGAEEPKLNYLLEPEPEPKLRIAAPAPWLPEGGKHMRRGGCKDPIRTRGTDIVVL